VLVTAVCSLKGGVGKTSVVLGLASAALAKGVPTLIVDLDPQADATTGLDVVPDSSGDIAAVLTAPRRKVVEAAITPSGWSLDQPGLLDVLHGSPDVAALDTPRATERALSRLSQALDKADGYSLVLIDCPPSLGALTRTGLTASQRAIVVTEPALFSVTAADRALNAIEEIRATTAPSLQPLGVLVNRYRDRSPEHRYRMTELAEMFGSLIVGPPVPERSALQQAQGASRSVHSWPGQAGTELARIFEAHLSRLLRSAEGAGRRRRTIPAAV
jgi:cellulose biosynthesis protein BcsQ